jgi:murein DD-endopeptidase MepM/ murein hydrolase activator NlpD
MRRIFLLLAGAAALIALAAGIFLSWRMGYTAPRSRRLGDWFRDPAGNSAWMIAAGSVCGDAPLQFPTDGYIGFLWDDSWRPGHRHQGIDIFGPDREPGKTPVYAAYDGYLTRLPDWKSTVILRVPDDPLQPGRQVWMYYTHMADAQGNSFIVPDYPEGSGEIWVTAGTLLGYQGNFSGDPNNPTGTHLHFSIVKDDGQGKFLNELRIENTIDPSPYLGLPLYGKTAGSAVITCAD